MKEKRNVDLGKEKTYLQFNEYKRMYIPIGERDYPWLAKILNITEQECRAIDAEFIADNRAIARQISENNATTLTQLQQKKPQSKIIFIGDSNTSNRKSYFNILRETLAACDGLELIDSSVSGHTTQDVLNIFYASVLNQKPDLTYIMLGTNDLRRLNDYKSKNLTSLDEFVLNLRCIVERLLSIGCKIVLITVPYINNRDMGVALGEHNWLGAPDDVRRYNAAILEIAQEYRTRLVDLFAELEKHDIGEYLMADGLHLNSSGHHILAQLALERLAEIYQ